KTGRHCSTDAGEELLISAKVVPLWKLDCRCVSEGFPPTNANSRLEEKRCCWRPARCRRTLMEVRGQRGERRWFTEDLPCLRRPRGAEAVPTGQGHKLLKQPMQHHRSCSH
ncbi:hypothetical protein NDU88_002819, partial [Pleurodeles waltl]